MALRYLLSEFGHRDLAVLKIESELTFEARAEFQQAAAELFACDVTRLVIDLSGIPRMFSLFIGTLIDLGNSAAAGGKGLSVILPPQLERTCREAGLDRAVTIITRRDASTSGRYRSLS